MPVPVTGLYAVARDVCHQQGMDWTDPRDGTHYPAPAGPKPVVKVFVIAHIKDDLRAAWMQHVRDFDTSHPGCHFEIAADAPDMTVLEMMEQVRVTPGLTFQQLIERKKV